MIRYLSQSDIRSLTPSWHKMIDLIGDAVKALAARDFAQPVKPYLRYRNPINRIIAMPAFLGGNFDIAGLKWIASFPENIKNNLPRASSITILNHAQTGLPLAVLSSNELSGLRTAAVSGYVIKKMKDFLPKHRLKVGIIGFGPIGQLHAKMVSELLPGQIEELCVYDSGRPILHQQIPHLRFVDSWEEAFLDADIAISCTTSPQRYINQTPKVGSLHLNVSLRDYFPAIVMKSSIIIVDDWEEVCRENTDIERCAIECGLHKDQVIALPELITSDLSALIKDRAINALSSGYLSFHPMGMAVFDIALGQFMYEQAATTDVGVLLQP